MDVKQRWITWILNGVYERFIVILSATKKYYGKGKIVISIRKISDIL